MYIDKSKAKKHQVQYRTSIVVAVRRRWWCPSLSVVSGGCPSPCVTVGPHWWSSSLCIIVRRNPSPSPSPSIAIAVTISRQSLLSIVSRRRHRSSLSVVIVGLRRWSSSLVVSHRYCGCSRLVVGCCHWLSVVSHHHCGCRSWSCMRSLCYQSWALHLHGRG